jgi:hypothetical protein
MFTQFLSDFAGGLFADSGYLRDYQHASRLYVDSSYGMAPKAGWSYFIEIGLNPDMSQGQKGPFKSLDEQWYAQTKGKLGLVAKSADLPRFTVGHETINQYNKKSVIQTKITYNPITITFHDDMGNMTTNLWKNYYQYYYSDSRYLTRFGGNARGRSVIIPSAFNMDSETLNGTGRSERTFNYGLNNEQTVPFFSFIRIFLLNKQKYSSVTLINPIITEWSHSQLDNTSGNKMLENKMTVAYEAVYYDTQQSRITKNEPGFNQDLPYDNTKSPLRAGKGGGISGLLSGSGDLLDNVADGIENGFTVGSIINLAKDTKNLYKNYQDVKKVGFGNSFKQEAYSIASSTLSDAAKGRGAFEDNNPARNLINTPLNSNFYITQTSVNLNGQAASLNGATSITYNNDNTVTRQYTLTQAWNGLVSGVANKGVPLK